MILALLIASFFTVTKRFDLREVMPESPDPGPSPLPGHDRDLGGGKVIDQQKEEVKRRIPCHARDLGAQTVTIQGSHPWREGKALMRYFHSFILTFFVCNCDSGLQIFHFYIQAVTLKVKYEVKIKIEIKISTHRVRR